MCNKNFHLIGGKNKVKELTAQKSNHFCSRPHELGVETKQESKSTDSPPRVGFTTCTGFPGPLHM